MIRNTRHVEEQLLQQQHLQQQQQHHHQQVLHQQEEYLRMHELQKRNNFANISQMNGPTNGMYLQVKIFLKKPVNKFSCSFCRFP